METSLKVKNTRKNQEINAQYFMRCCLTVHLAIFLFVIDQKIISQRVPKIILGLPMITPEMQKVSAIWNSMFYVRFESM